MTWRTENSTRRCEEVARALGGRPGAKRRGEHLEADDAVVADLVEQLEEVGERKRALAGRCAQVAAVVEEIVDRFRCIVQVHERNLARRKRAKQRPGLAAAEEMPWGDDGQDAGRHYGRAGREPLRGGAATHEGAA